MTATINQSPAVKRAVELAGTPMGKVPMPALKFARYLCRKLGMCGEMFVTAYAAYAQIVEGLECDDPLYAVDEQNRAMYEEAQKEPDVEFQTREEA